MSAKISSLLSFKLPTTIGTSLTSGANSRRMKGRWSSTQCSASSCFSVRSRNLPVALSALTTNQKVQKRQEVNSRYLEERR
jgi:hypothetical protein